MSVTPEITKDQWVAAYVKHTLETAGFTHFDDGASVEEYAKECAEAAYSDALFRDEGPEACAESDMSYWGEE